jgi:hypothetical protein
MEKESEKEKDENLDISIQLDYEEYISRYISDQKYNNDNFRKGIVSEFDEIIRIYHESYKSPLK